MKSFFANSVRHLGICRSRHCRVLYFETEKSWEEFVEKFFWAKIVHDFIGHNVPIVTDDIFYI